MIFNNFSAQYIHYLFEDLRGGSHFHDVNIIIKTNKLAYISTEYDQKYHIELFFAIGAMGELLVDNIIFRSNVSHEEVIGCQNGKNLYYSLCDEKLVPIYIELMNIVSRMMLKIKDSGIL